MVKRSEAGFISSNLMNEATPESVGKTGTSTQHMVRQQEKEEEEEEMYITKLGKKHS